MLSDPSIFVPPNVVITYVKCRPIYIKIGEIVDQSGGFWQGTMDKNILFVYDSLLEPTTLIKNLAMFDINEPTRHVSNFNIK